MSLVTTFWRSAKGDIYHGYALTNPQFFADVTSVISGFRQLHTLSVVTREDLYDAMIFPHLGQPRAMPYNMSLRDQLRVLAELSAACPTLATCVLVGES